MSALRTSRTFLAVLGFWSLTALAVAQSQTRTELPASTVSAVDQAVQAQMQQQQLAGVAIGVIQNEKVAYVKGYGLANVERRIPVTEQTVFNWASNSKPMIAVAAMQLVEKNMLDLDADVRTYVPEFPNKGATITIRHLLCHQSGIPHYSNGTITPLTARQFPPAAELDPVVSLNRFGGSPLLFAPGERQEYSSYAYVLLSAAVQRAGKQPLNEQLTARIIKPLGLGSFQLDLPERNQRFWASGYKRNAAGQIEPVKDYAHFWKHGAGGYKSNIVDFARWSQALLARELVSESSEQTMWKSQSTKGGGATPCGLGFFVSGEGEGLRVSHGGSHDEVKTHLLLYPGRKEGIVVMCNCGHANAESISAAIEQALK